MGKPHGIIIFGANGSGKTTLGRELARVLSFKHIDHEDYAFHESKIPYAKPRSEEECIELMLADIQEYGSFVLSSVTGNFGDKISSLYDFAVYLTVPHDLRIERIKQREVLRFGDRMLKGGDMYAGQQDFHNFVSTRDLSRIDQWAETLACPVVRIDGIKDYKQTASYIANFYNTHFKSIGLPSFPDDADIIRRISARGVCIRDGKALMIKYKWPGYGFAGGGIEKGENPKKAIIRELREEIGYTVTSVGDFILNVTERTVSEAYSGKYFEQVNLYYECEVNDTPYMPNPTPEEAFREYESVWVELSEALRENESIWQRERDVEALKMLKDMK